jgi:hypothetical protein
MAGRDHSKEQLFSGPSYTSALPSDWYHQSFRYSLGKPLMDHYPPPEEVPAELRDLVARLDKLKV